MSKWEKEGGKEIAGTKTAGHRLEYSRRGDNPLEKEKRGEFLFLSKIFVKP